MNTTTTQIPVTKQMEKDRQLQLAKEIEALQRKAVARIAKQKKNKAIKSREQLLASIFGITTNQVTAVSARGTNILYIPQASKCSGVTRRVDMDQLTEVERMANGLSNRLPNETYEINVVDGVQVKRCVCCNSTFPLTNFSKSKALHDGHMGSCKDCDANRKKSCETMNKQFRAEDVKANVEKVCGCCKIQKPITSFSAMYASHRGSSKRCKTCTYDAIKATKISKKEIA